MKNFKLHNKGLALLLTGTMSITILTGGLTTIPYITKERMQLYTETIEEKKKNQDPNKNAGKSYTKQIQPKHKTERSTQKNHYQNFPVI